MSATAAPAPAAARGAVQLPRWWPLAACMLLAAALRLSTLGLQSFWYDEAFTPVHVLHPSLSATLHAVVHTENSPPLWYILEWLDWRVLGSGEVALRLPSALAGIATVPVAWWLGCELAGRRAAVGCALLVAVNPLFVWYSQEARVYGLFVLTAALATVCFVRAEREPTRGRMAAFAAAGAVAMLTHYFAVFLLVPMALWMLYERRLRRAAIPALAALAVVGLALLPLVSAQGGHGTQWIGSWPLSKRLLAIPQYYLLGTSGEPLGHGIELLVALPILAGLALALWRLLEPAPAPGGPRGEPRQGPPGSQAPADASPAPAGGGAPGGAAGSTSDRGRTLHAALLMALVSAGGVLIPLVLVAFGADYLAPRNLVGAMVPLTALIAVLVMAPETGTAGVALLAVAAAGFLAVSIDVDLSPRLQRGNWRGVADALRAGPPARAITSVELGSAPLQYYLPALRRLPPGRSATVGEIDETGYRPLRSSAGTSPAPGFHLLARLDVDGLIVYRFVSRAPESVSEAQLRRHVITLARPSVLVSSATPVARVPRASGY